jgi:bifunctional DNA-binding transcriptional regulator/antitoxin component of YhaV-PrlF toxin-antitoxin module
MKKHVLKLNKRTEYNYCITVPKEIIDKYGWKAKQKLTIEDKGRGELKIKDWRSR